MVIELVELRLKPGTAEADFVAASEQVTAFLATLPGFIARRLAKGPDDIWIDYVEWQSLPHAQDAAAQFNSAPVPQLFNSVIAPSSVRVRHFDVLAHT